MTGLDKAIALEKFEGHLVLYCKGHYDVDGVDFLTGVKRIWAVRCGIGVEHIDNSISEYIADSLYKTIQKTMPQKIEYLYQIIHKEIANGYMFWHNKDLRAIDKLITIYRSQLLDLQIKEGNKKGGYTTLVKLPKPQKRLFKRIIRGNGKFNDYELVK